METAPFDALAGWQEIGQRTDSGGFGGTFFTLDQYASQFRVNHVQDQRFFHGVLANDGGKWECSLSFHNK